MCPYYPFPIHLDKISASYERAEHDDPEYRAALSDYWKLHEAKVEFRPEAGRLWMDGESGFYLPRLNWKGHLIEWIALADQFIRLLQAFPSARTTRQLFHLRHLAAAEVGVRFGRLRLNQHMMHAMFHILTIRDALERHSVLLPENHVFLEIGAGSGYLSALWKIFHPHSQIVILDVPSVLRYSSYLISRCFPDSQILFYCDWQAGSSSLEGYDFVMLPHFTVHQVPDRYVNVVANVGSMQEMHIDTIKMYFSEMRRFLETSNLFLCVNREEKRVMGSSGNPTRFDDYPFVSDDIHLIDTFDPFLTQYLAGTLQDFSKLLLVGKNPFRRIRGSPVKCRLSRLVLDSY